MKRIVWIMLFISFLVNGQTGIGTAEVSPNTALQVTAPDQDKGLILPRVNTVERDAMLTLKVSENGLIIFNTDEQVIQYWSDQAGEWKTFVGKISNAAFTVVNCTEVKAAGEYFEGQAVSEENFVEVTVNVTKPGMYTIKAASNQDNGYFYYTEGQFIAPGEYHLVLPAFGAPIESTETNTPDTFSFFLNGVPLVNSSCGFSVDVEDTKIYPNFTMLCHTVEVKGVYRVDKPMEEQHHIKITVQANPEAIGAYFHLQTNVIDGVKFEAKGRIQHATQEVILEPTGVFTTTEAKEFLIMSNSSSSAAICHAKVRVVVAKKRVFALGNARFGYNIASINFGINKLLTGTEAGFGTKEHSLVLSEGFEIINGGPGKAFFEDKVTAPGTVKISDLKGHNPPDILIFGYNVYEFGKDVQALADYLRQGGIIIAFMSNQLEGMELLMKELMRDDNITVHKGSKVGDGLTFKFSNLDDPVLNGPFGDLRGKHWGKEKGMSTEANNITTLLGLDTSRLVVYSDAYEQTYKSIDTQAIGGVTAFRHKDYNFIWVGDPGFYSDYGNTTAKTSIKSYPGGGYDSNNLPVPKQYGANNNTKAIYNSVFMANLFAWAIDVAEREGINANKGN